MLNFSQRLMELPIGVFAVAVSTVVFPLITRYAAAGSFKHTDAAGLVRFGFSGRVAGHKLARGRYRLRAVPRNAAGAGRAVTARFRILG